ncbi:MAG: SWIM zinc finger family protein [Acidimicrobiia bacterium]|nr:SWIM zinc finger family protein [Acidimicrobiia bacterium]
MRSPHQANGTWTVEHVAALAAGPAQFAAADDVSIVQRWSSGWHSGDALWGTYRGAANVEPYEVVVDLRPALRDADVPRTRCTCPSRKVPCKHALALLLRWVRGDLVESDLDRLPDGAASWLARSAGSRTTSPPAAAVASEQTTEPGDQPAGDEPGPAGGEPLDAPPDPPPPDDTSGRDERVERMLAGLVELERWLRDRMRSGLADPSLASYATWDHLAARLVDARAGALANRVRRLAGLVGASPQWHGDVLAELGMLHLLARGGRSLPSLPSHLADSLATALGWQVRQADVLDGVPETDTWDVIGRSDTREDRIEVRRTWLRGRTSARLAMVLSFAAYRQSLDRSLPVGTAVEADLHRYPGAGARAIVGARRSEVPAIRPSGMTLAAACEAAGASLAAEPWAERTVVTVDAAVTRSAGSWVVSDETGSLPCATGQRALGAVLATTGGARSVMTAEWTPGGLLLLSVHLDDRTLDIGPRADRSFVEAA